MSKKEKIVAICYVISFLLLICSTIYTTYQNKPSVNVFLIEKVIKKMR